MLPHGLGRSISAAFGAPITLALSVFAALGSTAAGCGLLLDLDSYSLATCDDAVKDGDESDIDCGGGTCKLCEPFRFCRAPMDCASGVCTSGQCAAPACGDDVKNGSETDIDCGGGECEPCGDLQVCASASDCASGVCSGGACAVPACDDGVANGSESDVDCGGAACARCENGGVCATAVDCVSGGCAAGACGPWAKALGGSMVDMVTSVAVDQGGDIYAAGLFSGTVSFGGGELTSAGGLDIFLVRYSPDGAHVWSKRFGGPSSETVRIALDSKGEVLLVGTGADVDFGNGKVGVAGERTIFVAKLLGKNGAHVWSTGFSAFMAADIKDVTADASGDVYICGVFDYEPFYAGKYPLIFKGGVDGYVAKLTALSGKHIWSRSFGGDGDDYVVEIEAAPDGSIVIAGGFSSPSFDLGGAPLANESDPGRSDLFIAKLPGDGAAGDVWSKRYGSKNDEAVYALAVDRGGQVLVAGSVSGVESNVGGKSIDCQSSDGFVAKYDGASGSHVWSSFFQGAEDDLVRGIAVDALGSPIVIGYTRSGSLNFGGAPVVNPGAPEYDVFLAKYNGVDGGHVFSAGFGSGFSDIGMTVAVDQVTRNVVMGGIFRSVMSPGDAQIESAGNGDGFIVSFGNIP